MSTILLTGASGFVGQALIPKLLAKGHTIYGLSRHPPTGSGKLIPLQGDITKPELGLDSVPKNIDAVYHLAGVHTLQLEDKDDLIYQSNVIGTEFVLSFCLLHKIRHLFFTSTAYTWPVNPYGMSKIQNEKDIATFCQKHDIKATIFKLSIVMGTPERPYPGHFSKFITGLIQIHKRAELVRRKIEGTIRLPILEPLFRIKGNPDGKLNLVPIDAVAQGIASIRKEGTFWLTNPKPPTLSQLAEWVGEFIMLKLEFMPEFKPTPLESLFQKLTVPFEPYLEGDDFPSDIKNCPPITREFIHDTVRAILYP